MDVFAKLKLPIDQSDETLAATANQITPFRHKLWWQSQFFPNQDRL